MESFVGRDEFMAEITLEERVKVLETELAEVKKQLANEHTPDRVPWWEQRFGAFADSNEYEEAMRLGREYRESLSPKDDRDAAA